MKKIDFLIGGIILLIAIFIYLNFNNKYNSINNIELIINNEIIDNIDINNNCEYIITSDNVYIYIYKNDQLIKTIDNKYTKNIYNKVSVKDKTITISESNCKGKDCLYMKINDNVKLPIICTNGVVIKINKEDSSDIII